MFESEDKYNFDLEEKALTRGFEDDNAMDVSDAMPKKSRNEPLIWRPVFNEESPPSKKSASPPPPPLAAFTTKAVGDGLSAVLDYSSNSSESKGASEETVVEQRENEVGLEEIEKLSEGGSSHKHKKKKKNKDKKHHKKKDKEKGSADSSMTATTDGHDETSTSKKKDKRLKKLLKKEQRRLEKQGNGSTNLSQIAEGESVDKSEPSVDPVQTKSITLLETPKERPPSTKDESEPIRMNQNPTGNKLSLKISKGSLVKTPSMVTCDNFNDN